MKISGSGSSLTERYGVSVFFAVVFTGLLVLYLPTFSNPPHGDYWEGYYQFRLVRGPTDFANLINIINHDPWQDGTFRPFSYLSLYLEHELFGSEFIWNHIVDFLLYCLSVVLLYRLTVSLKLDRMFSAVFLGVYVFLFPHSGILTLTFHQFVIAGFSAFLSGFIAYVRWLKRRRKSSLIFAGLFFLSGMLCYESFGLWPLSIIFLRRLYWGKGTSHPQNLKKPSWWFDSLMLSVVYLAYFSVFRLTRTASVTTSALPEITEGGIGLSLGATFFNLSYNGILMNLFPFLTLPCWLRVWVEMGGLIKAIPDSYLPPAMVWGGITTMILIGFMVWLLYRHRKITALSTLIFFLYLYF